MASIMAILRVSAIDDPPAARFTPARSRRDREERHDCAAAGTGRSRSASNRYVRLFFAGTPAPESATEAVRPRDGPAGRSAARRLLDDCHLFGPRHPERTRQLDLGTLVRPLPFRHRHHRLPARRQSAAKRLRARRRRHRRHPQRHRRVRLDAADRLGSEYGGDHFGRLGRLGWRIRTRSGQSGATGDVHTQQLALLHPGPARPADHSVDAHLAGRGIAPSRVARRPFPDSARHPADGEV
jgi:hypothetical protein